MINKRILLNILALIVGVTSLISMESCSNLVNDNLGSCPQRLAFNFFSLKARNSMDTIYPKSVKAVRVYAFDMNGVLQAIFEGKGSSGTGITDLKPYRLGVDFSEYGEYTFVTYAGENLDAYDFGNPVVGTSKREDVKVELKYSNGKVKYPAPPDLFYGVKKETLRDYSKEGSHTTTVPIELIQLTNNYTFTIADSNPGDVYQIKIRDNNAQYGMSGMINPKDSILYMSEPVTVGKDGQIPALNIRSLKLEDNPDRNPMVEITNLTTGVTQTVSLKKLIYMKYAKVDYDYVHDYDFTIRGFAGNHTYSGVYLLLNNWTLVSNDIILK